jgi:hypothetical protein
MGKAGNNKGDALHIGFIEKVANRTREMLIDYSPELVQSLGAFTNQSLFLLVSSESTSPGGLVRRRSTAYQAPVT